MKNSRVLLLLCILTCLSPMIRAQNPSVEFGDINLTADNIAGNECLIISPSLSIRNLAPHQFELRAYFIDMANKPISCANNQVDSFGHSYYSHSLPVINPTETFAGDDLRMEIPLGEICLDKDSDVLDIKVFLSLWSTDLDMGLTVSPIIRLGDVLEVGPAYIEETPEEDLEVIFIETPDVADANEGTAPQPATATGPTLIHQGEYYFTGATSTGSGWVKNCPATKSEIVRIYDNFIDFGGLTYRRQGTQEFNGVTCAKYCAVNPDGRLLTDIYLLRDGRDLMKVTELNIMGFISSVMTQIAEGHSPGEHYSPTVPNPSTPSYTPGSNTGAPTRTPRRCSLCNGTGRWGKEYAAQYSGAKKQRCTECGDWDYIHTHPRCPSCLGKGFN